MGWGALSQSELGYRDELFLFQWLGCHSHASIELVEES